MANLTITEDEFQLLPESCQRALLALFAADQTSAEGAGQPAPRADTSDEEPPDMSPAQAKKAYEAFSQRTKDVINGIVRSPVDGFELPDLEQQLSVQPGDLKGSWTGITKVTRRILGDSNAFLIWWTQNADGTWRGRLSPMTHKSFRKALGIN